MVPWADLVFSRRLDPDLFFSQRSDQDLVFSRRSDQDLVFSKRLDLDTCNLTLIPSPDFLFVRWWIGRGQLKEIDEKAGRVGTNDK